ncbi:MAG: redoxin family protein [bacterium]|nr:redoxin family protein [bacterium]
MEAPKHLHDDETEAFQHPWVVEMFRRGFSFNGNERNQLFLGDGNGSFVSYSGLGGADSPLDGRGLLAMDFDDDLDLDLFVHNIQRERHNLYRNLAGGKGQAIKVQLLATSGSPEAIGAKVELRIGSRRLTQVMMRGAGYASCSAPELLFGLGAEKSGELVVSWPYGEPESFGKVEAGTRWLLKQGAGKPQPLQARSNPLPDPWPPGLRIAVGEPLPPFAVELADGKHLVVDSSLIPPGGTMHLNLWASYCKPCVEELPILDKLHKEKGQLVMGISLDGGQARDTARKQLAAAKVAYPNAFLLVDDEGAGKQVDTFLDLFQLILPTTLEIDSDGRLVAVHQGRIDQNR